MSLLHILALDTTSRAGSVAVARDGRLLHQLSGDAGLTHGQRLPGDIMRALAEAGVRVEDLDLLGVAAGPGSFTGLRVGVAAVQGLAMARGLNVVPVPTLEALASVGVASAFRRTPERELIAAWMDGQRGEVFGALYEAADQPPAKATAVHRSIAKAEALAKAEGRREVARAREIQPPIAGSPSAVLDAWGLPANSPIVFIGDGAVRYRALLAARPGLRARVIEPPPLAAPIARIAFEEPHRAVGPQTIVPLYVRRSDAELARERRRRRPIMERVTSARDLDEVAALEATCFTNPWTREMLEREVRQADVARVYVLRDATGGVVAFCACWVVLDELHINTIAVSPVRRREGLASMLMQYVMDEAAQAGARRATLEVRASNDAARRLYAQLGFVESAIRPRYYTHPEEDAIILWRDGLSVDPP